MAARGKVVVMEIVIPQLCFMVAVVGTPQTIPPKIAFGAAAAAVGQALVPQPGAHQLMAGPEELAAQRARQAHSPAVVAVEAQPHQAQARLAA